MTVAEIFEYLKAVGGPLSPLLFLALVFLYKDRDKQIKQHVDEKAGLQKRIDAKDQKLEDLSQRTIVIMTEFKAIMTGVQGRAK